MVYLYTKTKSIRVDYKSCRPVTLEEQSKIMIYCLEPFLNLEPFPDIQFNQQRYISFVTVSSNFAASFFFYPSDWKKLEVVTKF